VDATDWIDALVSPQGHQLLTELAGDPPSESTAIARITQLRTRYPAVTAAFSAGAPHGVYGGRARARHAIAPHAMRRSTPRTGRGDLIGPPPPISRGNSDPRRRAQRASGQRCDSVPTFRSARSELRSEPGSADERRPDLAWRAAVVVARSADGRPASTGLFRRMGARVRVGASRLKESVLWSPTPHHEKARFGKRLSSDQGARRARRA
jgi:hypothetical protein